MHIISHRGYWQNADESNSEVAFKRSFDLGFGVETDVRDSAGELVISHDPAMGHEISLIKFLEIYGNCRLPLAINIKSDGLVLLLKQIMQVKNITRWFAFDMSIPDMRSYLQADLPVFARMSEVEQEPPWVEQVTGIWLDAFTKTWYKLECIENLLKNGKQVCVVSPELHKRPHESLWKMLLPLVNYSALLLCTDYPLQARDFFRETS